jgi:3-dehydro-L-gulonate 2-dehydrogenase
MREVLHHLFMKHGFSFTKAKILAETFTESSLVGVNSHGINRVPLFIDYINKGIVLAEMEAEVLQVFGSMERWDGKLGSGIINAHICTDRAIKLAKEDGMGLVALGNTNHWMRGGTYGMKAAKAGCIGIMFTNTQPNMPPWGGIESRIGNNPLVISVPRANGSVVLDMALSQFSFGKIHSYFLKDEKLPFHGGFDAQGKLSDDPASILEKERGLPIGYRKGSGLSMVLDMLATILSMGQSTFRIGQENIETGISQVFLCINPGIWGKEDLQARILEEIIDYTRTAGLVDENARIFYPGEQSTATRNQNVVQGIPVDKNIWEQVVDLA